MRKRTKKQVVEEAAVVVDLEKKPQESQAPKKGESDMKVFADPQPPNLNETPNDTWSLQQLQQYCRAVQGRMALDAWRLGWALVYAKAKQLPGNWGAWLNAYCPSFSKATASRYMKLARSFAEDELNGVALTEAYHKMGVHTSAKAKAGLLSGPEVDQTTVVRLNSPARGAGATLDQERDGDDKDETVLHQEALAKTPIEEPEPPSDGDDDIDDHQAMLLQEMGDNLPAYIHFLRGTIVSIMDADAKLRAIGWAKMDLISLSSEITALRHDLDGLEADMPQHEFNKQA